MIAAGVLSLLFVTYQLWGTGIRTDQKQRVLEEQFNQSVAQANANQAKPPATQPGENASGTTSTVAPGPPETLPGEGTPASGDFPPPKPGNAIGQIKIPKI